MTMLADVVDAVIGGDTHRDTHTLEMTSPTGATISVCTVANDAAGFAEALRWIDDHAPGRRLIVGLEGTRSYGIGLARAVAAAGLMVVEVERPRRAERRRGKSDPKDARLAALSVLRMEPHKLPTPRADGDREALRILLSARRDLTVARTAQINRLRALLLGGDDADRALAKARLGEQWLVHIARRRGRAGATREQAIRLGEARRLAVAIRTAGTELVANKTQLQTLVNILAPQLLSKTGVGPVSAAQALVTFSHQGRCRNDAAFAALAGASPIQASSGRIVRHRLNRGGDRAMNRALHDITLNRWRVCPRTHAYIEKRRAEGKTDPEIRRALKRYIARELFKSLNHTTLAALDNT